VAEKLFSPFFTTKTEGMGMGLNICRSVIEFHGGRLWFEPGAEGGTVFIFTLPLDWE
jgi:two-component system sensor histidine kinase DctS